MSTSGTVRRNREEEAKQLKRRIENVEKYFGQICEIIGSIARKNARLRDKGDLLARTLILFAEGEHFHPSLRINIIHFSENYSAVQDYRHAEVQRIEARVLKPLMQYGNLCKHLKQNVKLEITATNRALILSEKARRFASSNNKQQLRQAQIELERAQNEEKLYRQAINVELDRFEKYKLRDIKKVLTELVKVEMLFHAKALEYLSKCFENIQQINVEADNNVYHTTVKMGDNFERVSDNMRGRSQQTDSSIISYAGTTKRSDASATHHQSSLNRSRQSSRVRISKDAPQECYLSGYY